MAQSTLAPVLSNAANTAYGNRLATATREQATVAGSRYNRFYLTLIERRLVRAAGRARISEARKPASPRSKPDLFLGVHTALTDRLDKAKPATMGISLKSTSKSNGGSANHVARFWIDQAIPPALASLGWSPEDAGSFAERATPLLADFLGLGLRSARVAKPGAPKTARQAPSTLDDEASDLAMSELNASPDLLLGLVDLACVSMARGLGDDPKPKGGGVENPARIANAVHIQFAGSDELPGEDIAFYTRDLLDMAFEFRAEARADGRGRSVSILATASDPDGSSKTFPILTIKRKGGRLPSERYPDQAQVMMCMRGMRKLLRSVDGLAHIEPIV